MAIGPVIGLEESPLVPNSTTAQDSERCFPFMWPTPTNRTDHENFHILNSSFIHQPVVRDNTPCALGNARFSNTQNIYHINKQLLSHVLAFFIGQTRFGFHEAIFSGNLLRNYSQRVTEVFTTKHPARLLLNFPIKYKP
jgi:hypothetical protein